LPTEEEWGWAAHGGENGWTNPWGDDDPKEEALCWSGTTPRSGTCQVGIFPAGDNPQHIYGGALWRSILRHRSAVGGSGRMIGSQQGSVLPLVWTRLHCTLYSHVLSHRVGPPPIRPPASCSILRQRSASLASGFVIGSQQA
jgi:hypothetical protein